MPYSLTYYLISPAASASSVLDPGFPGDAAKLLCDGEMFDQAFFLELLDRLLPEEYLRPLKLNPDSGYEIFQALAATAERLSKAMHEVECNLVMSYADGPTYATVDVTFYRENDTAGAVTVKAGTLVTTSKTGRAFETTEDAVFGGTDLEITVAARAVAPGYEYNVRGQRVSKAGEVLPGEIDTVEVMLQEPRYGDPSIKVRQENDADGGYPDWLEMHGQSRGLTRAPSESNDAFRLRIRTLADTVVTPAALRRLATRILSNVGISWEMIETSDIDYLTCYDAPSPNVGTPTYKPTLPSNGFDTNNFVFDDPRDPDPFRSRLLGREHYYGGLIFVVEQTTVRDYGFALDDPASNASDFLDTGTTKQRGTPAYDATGDVATPAVLDGPDLGWQAAVTSFYEQLKVSKVAGVHATIDTYHTW